jgi:hypothetical protein
MKLQSMSDLHLEMHADRGAEFIRSLDPTGVDVLVLAGDITMARQYEDLENVFKLLARKYRHIRYVPGNHEYYKSSPKQVGRNLARLVKRWLRRKLSRAEVRELIAEYRGAGSSEPDREILRKRLGLSVDDVLPCAPTLGTIHSLREGPGWAERAIAWLSERRRSSAHEMRIGAVWSKETCRPKSSALRTPFLTSACHFVSSTLGAPSAVRDRHGGCRGPQNLRRLTLLRSRRRSCSGAFGHRHGVSGRPAPPRPSAAVLSLAASHHAKLGRRRLTRPTYT